MNALLAVAAALPMALLADVAAAASYSGNWPLTVTHSQRADGSDYCLTLSDDGLLGWPHSGGASLTGAKVGGNLPYGTFQVIDHQIVVTIEQPGGTGQNAGLVYAADARNGVLGKGFYNQVYGGTEFDSGVVVFGTKGGC
jgi:hypothetical protein